MHDAAFAARKSDYEKACELENEGKYSDAEAFFEKTAPYEDSEKHIEYCKQQIEIIRQNEENAKQEAKHLEMEADYTEAVNKMNEATTEASFRDAADRFNWIAGYKDADTLWEKCMEEVEKSRKDKILDDAKNMMKNDTLEGYSSALDRLKPVSGWRDSDELIEFCKKRIQKRKEYMEQGLCQYCGGTFKGVFSKKCSSCGKPKDY